MSQPIKKCIILARARTGSNLLRSYLNSHPAIKIKGEEFLKVKDKKLDEELKTVFEIAETDKATQITGFKFFYYHPIDSSKGKKRLKRFLRNNKDIYIIHLKRHNLLKVAVSLAIANKTDVWMSNERTKNKKGLPNSEDKKVTLVAKDCWQLFKTTRKNEKEFDRFFKNHKVHEITYETLIKNKDIELNKILKFLDLKETILTTELKKQNKEPLNELVQNYYDVKEKFKDSRFESFFTL